MTQAPKVLKLDAERGFQHNDLKPDNILLTENGSVRLGDFGLTSIEGDVRGFTRSYCAPEILMVGAVSSLSHSGPNLDGAA